MSAVMLETLAWTGVLIAAVLMARRPIARMFGPQVAYALWMLPLLRLALPPVTLPAWMAPQAPAAEPLAAPLDTSAASDAMVWQAAESGLPAAPVAVPADAAPQAGFDLMAMLADGALVDALVLVWLGGAGVFLLRRFAAYFDLRDALLADGREVGRIRGPFGPVRLVETPLTNAPLAMGVLDPVIVLPPGFVALHDRQARDLALAHELAHHRGGDLLVNVLVQPLFAMHWFNPLGRYGWLALRRDQEAACDARVMARRSADERAAYAALIARYAGAPVAATNAALTAPMACPVLGEKSIIHRLRSLSMSHISFRRRLAGGALLGAGLLALPLTASISYAASEKGVEAPVPPAPPAPPAAPDAPTPPAPPAAPEAPGAIMAIDPDAPENGDDVEVIERVIIGEDGKEKRVRMVFRGAADHAMQGHEKSAGNAAREGEHAAMMHTLEKSLAEADRTLAEMPRILEEALAAAEAARGAGQQRVIVKHECRPGSDEVSEAVTAKDGSQIVTICQSRVFASARRGLAEARDEIAQDKDIPEDTRKQILKELDRTIARWADKEG